MNNDKRIEGEGAVEEVRWGCQETLEVDTNLLCEIDYFSKLPAL